MTRRLSGWRTASLFLFLTACFAPGLSAARAAEPVVKTAHSLRVAGKKLDYVAEAGRVPIRDVETGEPHGYMFYTAYRVKSAQPRPVMFIWNGGPGSPATLLHFEAAGPKRLEGGELVDNDETLLPMADLVFVDPIGTGFSRPAKSEYATEFYGTLGDIASVTEFVRAWRLLNGAVDQPIYLMGESWGAGRAGRVAYALGKLGIDVDGLVLVSGGSGLSSVIPPELSQALRIVSYMPTVDYHGKTAEEFGGDLSAALEAGRKWAREEYAPALARLDSLSDDERERIAADLARFTGLAPASIDRRTLSVTPRQFRSTLNPSAGEPLNVFDMRLTDEPDTAARGVLERYFREDLGYVTDLPYVGVSGGFEQGYAPSGETPPSVGARWNYFTVPMSEEEKRAAIEEAIRVGGGPPRGGPVPPGAQEAAETNSKMRVLVASGMYDSLASCEADKAVEARLEGALAEAYSFKCYVGGHMMYRDAQSRVAFSNDIKRMISSARSAN